ncbi:MAG TPA: AtpZ/AtpI family protein [Kofleriaceae bacterium]|nr:AtpZ/AtpI family protein [Kofleriaceae bacterium]
MASTSAPAPAAPVLDPVARRTKRMYHGLSASSVGLELGLAVVLGLFGGMWLDKKLGCEPWLMLAGLMFGLVAGFRNVVRAVARAEKAEL